MMYTMPKNFLSICVNFALATQRDEQDAHAGGSGCGCSAAVLCGPLLRDMHRGKIHRLVFAGTGAMMSPTSVQQGQPIAGICHAVVLERSEA